MRGKISDYITAVATSATALFAWLAYRYALRSADPIVECDEPQWASNHKQLILRIIVRNRSAVTHALSSIEVRKPKGCTMWPPDKPQLAAQKLDLSWMVIRPIGTMSHIPFEHALDEATLSFVLAPPALFLSGKLRIVLTVSDKSVKPRQRRFVISKFIHAAKAKTTADIINKMH